MSGSPLHLHRETQEGRKLVAFMRAVFASGTPSFGSCAGLQVATVAAGGTVRKMPDRLEAGFARRITRTEAGASHPLLADRPPAYDAPPVHSDEVERLPDGALHLARNGVTAVQAAEIRSGPGTFWGTQYHPEHTLFEVATALRRQAADLVDADLVEDEGTLRHHADLIEALADGPHRAAIAWRLGLDEQVAEADRRTVEVRNFVEALAKPTASRRGRS